MATYFVSVHTLLDRLQADQAIEEKHYCHSDACFEDLEVDVSRTTRLKMIERKELDVRSTSCPATTTATRRPQRADH